MEKEILLPKLGESILSATILKWLKKEGDPVALDEPLLEVSTDKVASEIPSPFSGWLKKIKAAVNEEVKVGEVVCIIETGAGAFEGADIEMQTAEKPLNLAKTDARASEETGFLSPAVKRLIKEHNLSEAEVKSISLQGGRLSRQDVEAYLESKKTKAKQGPLPDDAKEIELISITPLRKKIVENLAKASQVPTASVFVEVDITALLDHIAKEKTAFLEKEKAKLTITSFIAQAIGRAASERPLMNSVFLGDKIQLNKKVNLGLAIDRKEGLIVPVIKNVDKKPFKEIAKKIASLKAKALEDKLSLEDLEGGTITLTNFGMGGVLFGIPILRYPESAIVGTGAIQKKTAFIDGKPTVKNFLPLSLTFDHRHIDGMYACAFLQNMKSFLEETTW